MAHDYFRMKKVHPILGALIFFTAPLSAGPIVRIERIDTENYPRIELSTVVSNPYPGYQSTPEKNTFRVFMHEGLEKQERSVERVDRLDHEVERLYTVMVIDATKSVRSKYFDRMTRDAKIVVERMKPEDKTAIYRINGKPDLTLEFTAEPEIVKKGIDSIERKGKITRIYDALYNALLTARSATQNNATGKGGAPFRSAVLLFTDGRDEGSFITNEDVAELTRFGRDNGIPIYTILYDRSANRRTFQRLARLTGGELLEKPDKKEFTNLTTSMRILKEVRFRITFANPDGWTKGPTFAERKYRMSLSWRSGRSADEEGFDYTVSALTVLTRSVPENVLYAILFTGLLLLTIGSVYFSLKIIKYYRKKSLIKKLRGTGTEEDNSFEHPLSVQYRQENGEPSEGVMATPAVRDLTGILNGTEKPGLKPERGATALLEKHPETAGVAKREVDEESASAAIALETLIEKERLRRDPASRRRMTLDEDKAAFLKDIAYRLLQTALRDAEAYESATLHVVDERREKREYDLFLETTVIGSGRWAHIHLNDKTVSPVHARIRRIDGKYILYDMLSESGLFLNGKKILRPKPLWNGDRIKMGRTEFLFHAVRGED